MLSRFRRKFGILFSFGPLAALLIISFQNATPTNAEAFETAKIMVAPECILSSSSRVSNLHPAVQRICR